MARLIDGAELFIKACNEQNAKVEFPDGYYESGITIQRLAELLDAQPEIQIVYCRDCAKRNNGVNDVIYLSDVCPMVGFRGKPQGHEFDYQYCVYGKR